MDRVTADRMGMLATVMNGLALSGALRQAEIANKVYSATAIAGVAQGYERDAALAAMNDGEVVILTGGTGNPYFTTDTAACLRGLELGVDAVLKATNVDGVYDSDPKYNAKAVKFDEITYDEVLERQLGVMDLTAIVLCRDHAMPLVVFDVQRPGALVDIAAGATVGSRVVAASSG
jgi:uridylate kinase